MSKKGSPWTPEEETDLLEGIKKGQSFEALSRIHQRSVKAVQWRFGLYCKKLLRQGKPLDQISREFGLETAFLQVLLEELGSDNNKENNIAVQTVSSTCVCKEDITSIKEKLDKQSRLLKKCLEKQEKILGLLMKK